MKKCFVAMIVVAVVLLLGGSLNAEEKVGESMYTKIETPHPYKAKGSGEVWSHVIHQPGASWLAVHFSKFNLADEDYVELIDMEGNVIETIKGADVISDETSKFKVMNDGHKKVSFYGPIIDGNEITVKLYSTSDQKGGDGFVIDEVGIGFVPTAEESVCGTNNLVDIKCKDTATQTLGLAVGRLYYQKSGSWYLCTGSLISTCSGHLLTNEHCISNQTVTSTLQVRFKYRYTTCGGGTVDSYSTYYGDLWIKDSVSYDYCLLTLKSNPQSTFGSLRLLNRAPILNEAIYIIQHPSGVPQKYDYGTVTSTTANSGKDLGYMVDTEGGSSGSPVFADTEDKVIGLHHYGGCPNSAVKMDLIYEGIIGYICQ